MKTKKNRLNKKELTTQEAYLQKHKRHHQFVTSWRLMIFIGFLILWEISADLGWIDSFFFSSPSRVA
ncbi:MAG: ABC transporter permease, partial [Lachnospiraceae bacterium]|nr:ABC transporter permease [Lachnospiraceae bacterium]